MSGICDCCVQMIWWQLFYLCVHFLKGPAPFNIKPFFLGQTMILTCGPLPPIVNFSNSWTRKWTRDGTTVVANDEHIFTTDGRTEILTVTQFFSTDNGKKLSVVYSGFMWGLYYEIWGFLSRIVNRKERNWGKKYCTHDSVMLSDQETINTPLACPDDSLSKWPS